MDTRNLLVYHDVPRIADIDVYLQNGGYRTPEKASRIQPSDLVSLAEAAGLRGRGGSGFPTGKKWGAVLQQPQTPHYFICNIAEGEPGSFKDRELLKNPHQVLEASALAAYAVGAKQAYLYLRGTFQKEEELLREALQQAETRKILGPVSCVPVELVIHRGEDSYVAGEETALIESLEGKPAIPRVKPPRPHESGLWECPTAVNNVETICNMIHIVLHGPDSFRRCGTTASPGTKLFCLSGQIRKPGLYELPMGIPLSHLLHDCGGGPLPGRKLLAVFPGGPSTPPVMVEQDPAMDFEGLEAAGSQLGTGGVIVLDDSTDIRKLAAEVSRFFARESCRACPPCTMGTADTHRALQSWSDAGRGDQSPALKIRQICGMMKFRGQCAHSRSAALTLMGLLDRFPGAFQ